MEYTRDEVARNNGVNGARVWIIIRGCVYDVTDYLSEHPGGPELINECAGADATKDFDDFGHSSDAKKMLKKYEIGVLASCDRGSDKRVEFEAKEKTKTRRKRSILIKFLRCGAK